ncbi:MAG: hypothetical protein M1817_001898 [Caeruleum heppii]|nr:MAG: hypothetical protein M1817_001898 [Caeruleum heppii]
MFSLNSRRRQRMRFFTSPYTRTRQTTEGILRTLTSDEVSPSPFPRNTIKVYEEPRLREQDFGNFQPCSAAMTRMWQERADYGHFFYRIPDGESAADAYDRVSGFNESLWRQFGDEDCASVFVLVTHGLMTRVFLMKWYHFSVEYFEDLRNVDHCEFVIMKKNLDSGKYILENNLRTWSALLRERAEEHARTASEGSADIPADDDDEATAVRWGGCPDGCTHGEANQESKSKPPPALSVHHSLQADLASSNGHLAQLKTAEKSLEGHSRQDSGTRPSAECYERKSGRDRPMPTPAKSSQKLSAASLKKLPATRTKPLLQLGRDFGGSESGVDSQLGSFDDTSEDDHVPLQSPRASKKVNMRTSFNDVFTSEEVRADALGDHVDSGGKEPIRHRISGSETPNDLKDDVY